MTDVQPAPAADADANSDGGRHAGDAGGHGHEPDTESLGAVDLTTWSYALAGGAVGVVTVLALFVAIQS